MLSLMTWLWQLPDWPHFTWDEAALKPLEDEFLAGFNRLLGARQHLDPDDSSRLRVDWLRDEAMDTSAIEGEVLDRDSVQSSIQLELGLKADKKRSGPSEAGIAQMLVTLVLQFGKPLTRSMLHDWHRKVMNNRRDLPVGRWRKHVAPMQVVSGPEYRRRVHYEAPPSGSMAAEMAAFTKWFAQTRLPPLTRAGIAHLYFVSIHPYEDGNGRLARALAQKALAQGLGEPSFVALSQEIRARQKGYYEALKRTNRTLEVTAWLKWFAETALAARTRTQHRVDRVIQKTRMLDRLRGRLNPRQEKVLLRLFEEEPEGFRGGLSAANYLSIVQSRASRVSPATVTRDLAELVEMCALQRTGEKRHTRYWLNLPELA